MKKHIGFANGHQYNAKKPFVIIINGSAIDWRLYSDMLAIYGSSTVGQIPNLIEILSNIFPIISGSWRTHLLFLKAIPNDGTRFTYYIAD